MALWGEVELPPRSPVKIALPEPKPAEFSIPKLWKLPVKTQPDSNQPPLDPSIQFPVSSKGRNIHLHNVDQINHIRRMRQLITQAQTQVQFLKTDPSSDEFDFPECPSPPHRFCPERLAPVSNYTVPAVFSASQRHKRKQTSQDPITILDRHRTHRLTRRAIELSLAHCGFNSASDAAVEILTDVLGDHLRKLCCLLRSARDDEGLYGSCGFSDCVERMLHEVGLSGVEDLQKHWLSSTWEYGVRLQETADSVHKEYEELQATWQQHKSGSGNEHQETPVEDIQSEEWKVETEVHEDNTVSGDDDLFALPFSNPIGSDDLSPTDVFPEPLPTEKSSKEKETSTERVIEAANEVPPKTSKRRRSRSVSASSPRKKRKG